MAFAAPRLDRGLEKSETLSRIASILISLPLYLATASNVGPDSKPSNEMALAAKRILVTDTGNDEDDHSRAMPASTCIYAELPRFLLPCNPITSSFLPPESVENISKSCKNIRHL